MSSQKIKRKKQKNRTSTGKWLKKVKEKRYLVGVETVEYDEIEVVAKNKKDAVQKALDSDDGMGLCGQTNIEFVREL